VAKRVAAARAIQQRRFGTSLITNATMGPKRLERFCRLTDQMAKTFETHIEGLGLSSRVHAKSLAIARTIADLDGGRPINQNDLNEALSFRQLDQGQAPKPLREVHS